MKLSDLVEKLGGVLTGDGDAEITGLAALAEAGDGDISFLSNPRYTSQVATTGASAVLVGSDWDGEYACSLVRVENTDRAFAQAGALLGPEPIVYPRVIHETAVLADDVAIGKDVGIGPYCVVESGTQIGDRTVLVAGCYVGHGVTIGEDCLLHSHVSVREHTTVGNRVIIYDGAVLGNDGFGYYKSGERWVKIPQVGTVEIGDDAEIGANTTVDRARFGKTIVAKGVKIDNLVMVAHNVRIDENTAIASQVGISGSARVGKNVQLGGQAGLAGHLEVGDNAIVGAQAGVSKSVAPATFVSGYPAMPHAEAARLRAHTKRIPHMKKRLAQLEQRVAELSAALGSKEAGETE
ncbi:MAG: UDP-3-O-(3-hydroxymyristoyl)glucosamine N-acyltransferase [Kiritimatiellia bacterium]|nr:UDP-3-O-(3-hydroxymyristoyl)glucosamine N-acyltransferase [Kiritimatiellia bacterium]